MHALHRQPTEHHSGALSQIESGGLQPDSGQEVIKIPFRSPELTQSKEFLPHEERAYALRALLAKVQNSFGKNPEQDDATLALLELATRDRNLFEFLLLAGVEPVSDAVLNRLNPISIEPLHPDDYLQKALRAGVEVSEDLVGRYHYDLQLNHQRTFELRLSLGKLSPALWIGGELPLATRIQALFRFRRFREAGTRWAAALSIRLTQYLREEPTLEDPRAEAFAVKDVIVLGSRPKPVAMRVIREVGKRARVELTLRNEQDLNPKDLFLFAVDLPK